MSVAISSPAAPASAFGDVATVLQLQLDRAAGLQGRVDELEGQMSLAHQHVRYAHIIFVDRVWHSARSSAHLLESSQPALLAQNALNQMSGVGKALLSGPLSLWVIWVCRLQSAACPPGSQPTDFRFRALPHNIHLGLWMALPE